MFGRYTTGPRGRKYTIRNRARQGRMLLGYNLHMVPDFLLRHPLFTSLSTDERIHLINSLNLTHFLTGEYLCRENDPGDRLFIIKSGNASVIKALGTNEERLLRILSPGDYTGEMSLLEPDGLRTATVRADTPLQAYEMTRPDFDGLLSRNPKLAIEMLREFSQRLRNSQQATIVDLQNKNIELTQAYRELQEAQVQIIEKERLERELQVARQIQMSMLPGELPQLQDYEFGAQILPARAVGGDLFDFIDLGNDLLGITVADVSDKGVPAALFMALTRSLLRAVALSGESPATVLRKVNHHLLGMNQAAMFVSVLYGILHRPSGSFNYARAGHELPALVDKTGQIIEASHKTGQLLGVFDEPELDEQLLIIPNGGTMLIYTDGATDAMNPEGDLFNRQLLLHQLINYRNLSAAELCQSLLKEITGYQNGAPQADDITLVAIKHK